MTKNKVTVQRSGANSAMLLFITFLVLKLTGVIGWSWWWVTVPLWGGLVIAAIAFALILSFILTLKLFKA